MHSAKTSYAQLRVGFLSPSFAEFSQPEKAHSLKFLLLDSASLQVTPWRLQYMNVVKPSEIVH